MISLEFFHIPAIYRVKTQIVETRKKLDYAMSQLQTTYAVNCKQRQITMQNIAKETRFQIRKKRKLSLNPERNLVVSGFDKIPENYITKLNVILNLRWTMIGLNHQLT